MDAQEYGMAVEPEGVPVHKIFTAGFVIFGTIAIAVVALFQIYNRGVQTTTFDAAEAYVAYPEIQDANTAGMRKITQFEVVDDAGGVYRIPVDRAMQMVVDERRAAGVPPTSEMPR